VGHGSGVCVGVGAGDVEAEVVEAAVRSSGGGRRGLEQVLVL
jgi:hypothetical protein